MATKKDYFLSSVRLASFRSQRRSSVSGNGGKATKWPHKNMAPKCFAEAGFYFDPARGHDDNVTCYLCTKSLDGWEAGDDPVAEHLRHSENCGWAITAATQGIPPDQHTSDPHGEQFRQARLMTFGPGHWPHKDSDNLSAANMASAGFHYAPTKSESDYCLCPFCGVSLANFEPDDDPRYEHEKRAPSCYFFVTEAIKKPSKRVSRTSTLPKKQMRRASRAQLVLESPAERISSIRGSVDTTEDDEPATKTARGKRAGSVKPKAAATKMGRKKAAAPEYQESIHSLSGVEDTPNKGRKRPSAAISKEPVILCDGRTDTDEDGEIVVQPKKRATRSSMAQQSNINPPIELPKRQRVTRASIAHTAKQEVDHEMSLTDAEDTIEVKPKKGRRTVSKSKMAPRPTNRAYMPTDEDLDHALEVDLERPLTDEDESQIHQKPFVRTIKRLVRSRASIAVEQHMKDAPSNILIHTARKPKSVFEGPMAAPLGKSPLKSFFRDGDQDFSMPVRIPNHLNQDIEILDQHSDTPSEAEAGPVPQPAQKRPRGRPRKTSVDQSKAEDAKPKRTKVAKKNGWSTRSRSNTDENTDAILLRTFDTATATEERTPSPQHEQPKPITRPKQKQHRESVVSPASTIPDRALYHQKAGAVIEDIAADDDPSDPGSVARHPAEAREPFVMHDGTISSDAHVELEEEPSSQSPAKSSQKRSPQKANSRHEVEGDAPEVPSDDHGRSSIPSSPFQEQTSPLPEAILDEKRNVAFADPMPRTLPAPVQPEDRGEERSPQLRSPLSPIRKQLRVPLQSTPKSKPARTLQTTQPWTPIDLDVVFAAPSNTGGVGEVGLTAAEREMTVEDWIKWKALNGQRRLNEHAERLIGVLESKGMEARMAIEGIPTI